MNFSVRNLQFRIPLKLSSKSLSVPNACLFSCSLKSACHINMLASNAVKNRLSESCQFLLSVDRFNGPTVIVSGGCHAPLPSARGVCAALVSLNHGQLFALSLLLLHISSSLEHAVCAVIIWSSYAVLSISARSLMRPATSVAVWCFVLALNGLPDVRFAFT